MQDIHPNINRADQATERYADVKAEKVERLYFKASPERAFLSSNGVPLLEVRTSP
jgi:hypothetical protein